MKAHRRAIMGTVAGMITGGCIGSTFEGLLDDQTQIGFKEFDRERIDELKVTGNSVADTTPVDQFQVDAGNSGYVRSSCPHDLRQEWKRRVGSHSGGDIVVGDNRVIRADRDGLHAITHGGEPAWGLRRPFDEPRAGFVATPTITPDAAYVGLSGFEWDAANAGFVAVGLADGTPNWWTFEDLHIAGPSTIHEGVLYFTAVDKSATYLCAADARTGEPEWITPIREPPEPGDHYDRLSATKPLAVEGEKVFACLQDPNEIICLRTRDGTRAWRVQLEELIPRTLEPPVATSELVLVYASEQVLLAFDHDGEKRWHFSQGVNISMPIPVVDREHIYLISESGITALSPDGTEQWRYDYEFADRIFPPVVTEDALIVNDITASVCISTDDPDVGGLNQMSSKRMTRSAWAWGPHRNSPNTGCSLSRVIFTNLSQGMTKENRTGDENLHS